MHAATHDAAQLWLGGATTGEAAAESNYKAHQASPVCPMYSCLVRPDRQTVVVRRPTMNSPSRADRLGRVYSLVEVSIAGIRVLLQYRCSIVKVGDSTCMLFVDATPADPTATK